MRMFKPYTKRPKLTEAQNALLASLPRRARKAAKRRLKKRIGAARAEAYDRTKLRASGLWDASAAKKGSLVVTRIVKDAPSVAHQPDHFPA